jgi:FtsZ-binding cell division protein ZapB
MISVEQVRALEERVEKAVAYIASLKTENTGLRHELDSSQAELAQSSARIAELEAAAEAYRRDQVRIEEGIVHALRKLDAFEDLMLKAGEGQARGDAAEAQPHPRAAPEPSRAAMDVREGISERPSPARPSSLPSAGPGAGEALAASAPLADELSEEELEAATAPGPAVETTLEPETPVHAVENELDIF